MTKTQKRPPILLGKVILRQFLLLIYVNSLYVYGAELRLLFFLCDSNNFESKILIRRKRAQYRRPKF